MPWLLDIDPEVWPIFKGWPWGMGIGPLLNIPFPKPIRLKIGKPIIFERTGPAATKDLNYLLRCYDQVHDAMQRDLNELVQAPLH
ncbi:MAG: hypothetical protein HC810_07035 [Acaryochloridaceae cyanobacterium RL_2_7]|nr:hypothetical protein [Acaryochloridaceae cyanobacterium RL_2_7]